MPKKVKIVVELETGLKAAGSELAQLQTDSWERAEFDVAHNFAGRFVAETGWVEVVDSSAEAIVPGTGLQEGLEERSSFAE